MMTKPCPQCGAEMPSDGPYGVCPKCFMGLGFVDASGAGGSGTTAAAGARFVPPKPDELAPHFPQLEILELIGQGGMGAVYKARQRGLDRLVALKILPPQAGEDPSFAERFRREGRALAQLNHPHIVSVYDSDEVAGLYYFIMEYVEGVNLRDVIRAGALEPAQALAVVPQLCDALQYAHDEGIVHRDIKPENVLIDRKGRIKIADFGLARLMGKAASGSVTLTATHQVMGTPRYMAPEQMEGSRAVDHRADIYSLGVVFYEMLTGELPLGRFEPPSRKVRLDVRLDEVVLRTLEKEPARRYQHASDIKSELESITGIEHLPLQVRRLAGFEYRSESTLFGWPLLHIATGVDPRTGRKRIAKGVIAIGDVAIGGIAIGGAAVGVLAFAGAAVGMISVAGASLGVLLSLGGAAVGLGLSIGGLAVGSVAMGGMAIGIFAMGGGAVAVHGLGANVQDPVARQFFGQWGGAVVRWLPWLSILIVIIPLGIAAIANAIARRHLRTPPRPAMPPRRLPSHRPASGCMMAVTVLFLLVAGVAVVLTGAYLLMATSPPRSTDPAIAGSSATILDMRSGEPALSEVAAEMFRLNSRSLEEVNRALEAAYAEYLAREQDHLQWERTAQGHQIITIASFPETELESLEHELWTRLDAVLDVGQQQQMRNTLPVHGRGTKPGLLGWARTGVRIEIWKLGSWFHWRVEGGFPRLRSLGNDGHRTGEFQNAAPQLPHELRRFWRSESP